MTKYGEHAPKTRFLVFIPACNEELVIRDVIRSVQKTEYPSSLIDIFVIADNCTDQTRARALAQGARVIETKSLPGEPVGKPHAIKKVLTAHPEFYEDYDMLTIFDADNVVGARFFAEVNSQYLDQGKPAAIQGYLGCKNKAGLVAFYYYHSYTLTNRFFQLTRYRLGINCSVGGTGLAFCLKALARVGGWRANTLTEDMEMQLLFTRNGERILWNHYAKIYDEKPTTASTAFKQRTRWSQGHWYVSLRNAGPLIGAFFRRRIPFKELISSFFYMFSMPLSVQIPLLAVMAVLTIALRQFQPLVFLGLDNWSWLHNGLLFLTFLYTLFGLFFVADYMDNQEKPRFSSLCWVVASYITLYPLTLVSQVLGFFRHGNQRIWVKTDHGITVTPETDQNESQNVLNVLFEEEPQERKQNVV
ncbi:MAG: glycosyltransferase [Clostridia bacterium]|nr:glycosyltransferase [Clostridia bacterium]